MLSTPPLRRLWAPILNLKMIRYSPPRALGFHPDPKIISTPPSGPWVPTLTLKMITHPDLKNYHYPDPRNNQYAHPQPLCFGPQPDPKNNQLYFPPPRLQVPTLTLKMVSTRQVTVTFTCCRPKAKMRITR